MNKTPDATARLLVKGVELTADGRLFVTFRVSSTPEVFHEFPLEFPAHSMDAWVQVAGTYVDLDPKSLVEGFTNAWARLNRSPTYRVT